MTDTPLFNLDAEGRWRLAYDSQQWVVQRRTGKPCRRGSDSAAMRRTGWKGVSFVGSKKATLDRLFREKGIVLTTEARAWFDTLPDQFSVFRAELAEADSPAPCKAPTAHPSPSGGPNPQQCDRASTRVVAAPRPEAA